MGAFRESRLAEAARASDEFGEGFGFIFEHVATGVDDFTGDGDGGLGTPFGRLFGLLFGFFRVAQEYQTFWLS